MKTIKLLFIPVTLCLFLSSCSSSSEDIAGDFLNSDQGLAYLEGELGTDSWSIDEYTRRLQQNYTVTNKGKNKIRVDLSEELKLDIQFQFRYKRLTEIKLNFDLDNGTFALEKIQELSTLKSAIDETILSIKGKPTESIDNIDFWSDGNGNKSSISADSDMGINLDISHDVSYIGKKYSEGIKDFISKNEGDEISIFHVNGYQKVPEGKFWVIKKTEYVREVISTLEEKNMRCECPAIINSNNYGRDADVVLNGRCTILGGAVNYNLRKYTEVDSLYNENLDRTVTLSNFVGMFPGTEICVNKHYSDYGLRPRLIVESYNIEDVPTLKKYYDYYNSYSLDKGTFEYVQFMNLDAIGDGVNKHHFTHW